MFKKMMMVAGALAIAGFVNVSGLVAFGQEGAAPGKKDAPKSDNAAAAVRPAKPAPMTTACSPIELDMSVCSLLVIMAL